MRRREFFKLAGTAAACSGVAFWAGWRARFPVGRYVQFGTSLTAGTGSKLDGMIPALVGRKLGIDEINGGCPGSCAGNHKFPEMDPVSLYALTSAIVSGDWSAQRGRRDAAIGRLMTVGFENVTYVGLEYGTNDFRYDRPIGEDSNTGSDTFKGALNYSVQSLVRRFPKLRVFLMTPWWMPTFDGRDSDVFPNEAGFLLRDYVAAMSRVAQLNHIPCLDLWSTSGVGKLNVHEFTSGDGVHLNDAGAVRRAEIIAAFMRRLF
jgi:lysophospholipase L1-like esterase